MPLIYCPACDRSRLVEQLDRRPNCCGNCGAAPPIIIRKIKIWHKTAPNDGIDRIEARRQAFAGLAYWATEKRYAKAIGWTRIKFKTLFGVWPDASIELTPPAPIRHGLFKWLEKQNARYTAQRRKAAHGKHSPKREIAQNHDVVERR